MEIILLVPQIFLLQVFTVSCLSYGRNNE